MIVNYLDKFDDRFTLETSHVAVFLQETFKEKIKDLAMGQKYEFKDQ